MNNLHFLTVPLIHAINVSNCTALWMQIITSYSLTGISCVSVPFCVEVSESSAIIVCHFCTQKGIGGVLPKYLREKERVQSSQFLALLQSLILLNVLQICAK